MDDAELEQLLESLEASLDRLGLGAIVEQERTSAVQGTVVETTRDDVRGRQPNGAAQPEVGDVRRVPLTSRERLAIILDLVEVAVGGTFALEEHVLAFVAQEFSERTESDPGASFRDDRAEGFVLEDERNWRLESREGLEFRRGNVRDALSKLQELREAADIQPSGTLAVAPDRRGEFSNKVLGWA